MKLIQTLRQMPAGQRRSGKALITFFALMLAFSGLSRALDSFTVAQVSTTYPVQGAIVQEVTLQGSAEPLGETAIALPEGFRVRELPVKEGSRIAAGDVLAVLDTEHIEEQLTQARRELQDARLAAASKSVKAETPEYDPLVEAHRKLERVEEDAELAAEAARDAIARAESDLREAQRERRRLREEGAEDAEVDAVQKEILQYGYALEDAHRAEEEARIKAERAIQDAETAIDDTRRTQEEEEMKEAASDQINQYDLGRDSLTIAQRQEIVTRLEALMNTEGIITAEQEGLVTKLNVKTGDITSSSGALLLSGQGGGAVFTADATKSEAEKMEVDDTVEILFSGQREPVAARIAAIRAPEEAGGSYTVEVNLPDADLRPGTAGKLTMQKRSSADSTLVPLSALHTRGGDKQGYVYVLRERNTTMGTQMVVEELELSILDRGATTAAVQAVFDSRDQIVTASSRPLSAGDRVRLGDAG